MKLLLAAALLALPLLAQPTLQDASQIGLGVGTSAPDFTLPDQNHQPRSLKSLAGPRGLVLVFYRSADW